MDLKDFKNQIFFCLLTLGEKKISLRCLVISSYVRFSYKMSRQQYLTSCLAFPLLHTVCPHQSFHYEEGAVLLDSSLREIIPSLAFNPLKIGKGILGFLG